MLKISITARKGGQARSTTAFNLAGAFSQLGYRVVVIDADAQPTVSKLFLGEAVDALAPEETVAALYDDRIFPELPKVLHDTGLSRISVIPGHVTHLEQFDHCIPEEKPELCDALRDFMPELEAEFDICIFDTAPTTYTLTYSTLVGADVCLTPVICDRNAIQELPIVQRLVDRVTADRNSNLTWLGVFPSLYRKRESIHQTFYQVLQETLADRFIPLPIPVSAVVNHASLARKPLPLFKPKTVAAKAYVELAEAVLSRSGVTPHRRAA